MTTTMTMTTIVITMMTFMMTTRTLMPWTKTMKTMSTNAVTIKMMTTTMMTMGCRLRRRQRGPDVGGAAIRDAGLHRVLRHPPLARSAHLEGSLRRARLVVRRRRLAGGRRGPHGSASALSPPPQVGGGYKIWGSLNLPLSLPPATLRAFRLRSSCACVWWWGRQYAP